MLASHESSLRIKYIPPVLRTLFDHCSVVSLARSSCHLRNAKISVSRVKRLYCRLLRILDRDVSKFEVLRHSTPPIALVWGTHLRGMLAQCRIRSAQRRSP